MIELFIFGKVLLGLIVGLYVFYGLARLIAGNSEREVDQIAKTYHHHHPTFTDAEILNHIPVNNRQARHTWYRNQIPRKDEEILHGVPVADYATRHEFYRDQKRRKAVVLYRDGWVGILHSLFVGRDAVDEDEEPK